MFELALIGEPDGERPAGQCVPERVGERQRRAALEHLRHCNSIGKPFIIRRNGELLGQPRITFESPDASDDERLAYRIAVAKMLKRCAPLPFTDALGNALAGRPFTIRFTDQRRFRQAENAP